MTKTILLHALALALGLGASAAIAHGDEEHASKHVYTTAKVEKTAFGQEGDPAKVTRTIKLDMTDAMRFTPADVAVQKGETVRFVVSNTGRLLHEMVLGTPQALQEHAALMKKFPEMEHADANMAHVKPGKSGEIVWQFTEAGSFQFACLQPGHFEAGMLGTIAVRGDAGAQQAQASPAPAGLGAAAAQAQSEGEVRKIDLAQGKLTLRHGPLVNLDMPAMTMVFTVADRKLLEGLKEGDKVRFTADRKDGVFIVTAIAPAN